MLKIIMNKLVKILLVMACFLIIYFNINKLYANASSFPLSYQLYLNNLKRLHPNWRFVPLNTGLNWSDVVKNEGPNINLQRSAVPISYADVWKFRKNNGEMNVIENGWVTASELAVAYTMDPRNYLNETQIFQFETLYYDLNLHNKEGVEKIFYGTLMYQNNVIYTDTNGNSINMNKTYSDIVMEAAKVYGVSPYHLASRIRQETACDIQNNTSIKGNVPGYVGYYNYFNIGATGGENAAISGLAYARSLGWDNPEKAIFAGAQFIGDKYINKGQYTIYLQKFNVNKDGFYALYTHQYMQNILAPISESNILYNAYKKMNLLDVPYSFIIPVYDNMPSNPIDIYTSSTTDFIDDNTKVVYPLQRTGNLNVRSGPSTTYSAVAQVAPGTVMTRIARGVQSGERWDKVRLTSGVEGYVFQSYIEIYNYTKVTGIRLDKTTANLRVGDTLNLTAIVEPSNALYKNVYWTSNSDVVTVTHNGVVTAIKEGTAVVTTTTEDQNKTATCEITVNRKEPTITFDKELYTAIKAGEIRFSLIIENIDEKEYDLKIEDETIAKYENGKIIALSAGETTAIANIKGSNIRTSAKIKVIEVDGSVVIDESLDINGNVISKIIPGTKVSEIKDKMIVANGIEIKNTSGNTLSDDNNIGTGSLIGIKNANGEIIYTYEILIYGDISGDGIINSLDLLKIRQHILGLNTLSSIYYTAGNISKTDTIINSLDLLKMRQHLLKIVSIEQ